MADTKIILVFFQLETVLVNTPLTLYTNCLQLSRLKRLKWSKNKIKMIRSYGQLESENK